MSKNSATQRKLSEIVGSPLQVIKEEFVSVAEMQGRIMPDPERLTLFGDYDIFGMTVPTTIVGGDFFDFIDVEGRFHLHDKMGLVIADASGHGLSAAMLIRDFNTALYTAISFQSHYTSDTSPLLFEKINRRMFSSSLDNQFISAFYGELHRNGTLRYINAGHLPPILFKKSGIEYLEKGGPVLGAFRELPGFSGYEVGETRLDPGDRLVCYTDGVIEAANHKGEEYGLKRLEKLVLSRRALSSRQLFSAIMGDTEKFAGDLMPNDDRTLIIIAKPDEKPSRREAE